MAEQQGGVKQLNVIWRQPENNTVKIIKLNDDEGFLRLKLKWWTQLTLVSPTSMSPTGPSMPGWSPHPLTWSRAGEHPWFNWVIMLSWHLDSCHEHIWVHESARCWNLPQFGIGLFTTLCVSSQQIEYTLSNRNFHCTKCGYFGGTCPLSFAISWTAGSLLLSPNSLLLHL